LLGRDGLAVDEGIIIEASPLVPMMWMHTWFMRFPIDIVFLSRDNAVLRIEASLKPWRFSAMVFGAGKAVELLAGAALRAGTAVGDLISIQRIQTHAD
jgi:uncharacterized membrane protein (UPF0127 family)